MALRSLRDVRQMRKRKHFLASKYTEVCSRKILGVIFHVSENKYHKNNPNILIEFVCFFGRVVLDKLCIKYFVLLFNISTLQQYRIVLELYLFNYY